MPITDAMFLLGEAREKPMHVGGLQLFELPADADPGFVGELFRESVRHAEVAPLFSKRAHRPLSGLGPWEWQPDADLDLEYHVRHSALPHPGRVRELLTLVSRLHGTLLDRNRPLWEIHLVEGLQDGRVAVYSKIHHAMLDGVNAMRTLQRSLSPDPEERDMPPPWAYRRSRRSSNGSGGGPLATVGTLAREAIAGGKAVGEASVTGVRAVARALDDHVTALPYQAPRSMLNLPITGARRVAADSWELERLRAVGRKRGGSVNDVVLAMSAGALRRYLLDHDALPDQPLIAAVPVALGRDDDAEGGNAVGAVLCNLATHLDDPVERYDLIHGSMRDTKAQLEGLSQQAITLLSAISFGPVAFGPLFRFPLLRKPPFNIVISNVPGPREPLYWNGARLSGLYPLSIPFDGQAVNITVTSNGDELGFGIVGCRRRVPSLQRLLEHLETSLAELE